MTTSDYYGIRLTRRVIANLTISCLLFFGSFLLIAGSSQATTKMETQHTVVFMQTEIAFDQLLEYDKVQLLPDCDFLSELGKPMLPVREIKIALPEGMLAQTIRIVSLEFEELDGLYNILPAQPPSKIGQPTDNMVFIDPDPDTYSSKALYPAEPVELVHQTDLAGQAMAVVRICPLRYNPAQSKLDLITSISFVIDGTDGYICGDYLPQTISENGRRIYERMLKNMVDNEHAVSVTSAPNNVAKLHLPSDGPFDHVIITSDIYESNWLPLANWHTKKGVRDTIVTTSYIYANYSGSDNQEKIRNFVIDAHNNWGTMYVLIGGEHSIVPFEYRVYESDNIPSDQYYGDYDNDWTYEVFVGRSTAEGTTQINRFINKVITYETNPPQDDYSLNVCLVGMDLTLATQPPYYTLTASELLKSSINNLYIPSHFNVDDIYDSDMSNHRTDFINALNHGQNLVNHSDHSNTTLMGVGDLNHGYFIYSSHVSSLTNTNRMSVIFSLGCHALEMDASDCIGEQFVIYNDLKAGVAFTGNTRSGWFYVGSPSTLSGQLDLYWWRGLFMNDQYRLGEALAWTKNNNSSSGIMAYCQWTLNLLGEPEMPIWTDTIKTLVVSHPASFPIMASSFSVHVEDEHGVPVNNAYICLHKGSEVYERDFTDVNGDLSLNVNPSTQGNMDVTVTARNFIPYQGNSTCEGNVPPVADFTYTPLSPTCLDTIEFSSSSYDEIGYIVSWEWFFGDDSTSSGAEVAHVYEAYGAYIVTHIVEDDGGACDTIEVEVTVTPICGDVDDNGSTPNIADLIYLVTYMFAGGPEPPVIASVDVDIPTGLDIADLVYLVNFMFNQGPAPVCQYD